MDSLRDRVQSVFKTSHPSDAHINPYAYEQQPGCFVRVYCQNGKVYDFYQEIQSASTDKTTTDICGSFSLNINSIIALDELIGPDDFVRIFMGDKVMTSNDSGYNVASSDISVSGNYSLRESNVYVKIAPGGTTKVEPKFIQMNERFLGKIDRIERVSDVNSVTFSVSGRGFGSILQDISLYYNEYIPGLNAVNVFFGTNIPMLDASPGELITEMLSIVLSAVPLPQWKLPIALVNDLDDGNNINENVKLVQKRLSGYIERVNASNVYSGNSKALQSINDLIKRVENDPKQFPFCILSLKGIEKCVGGMFNRSFLSSQTTGFYDLLKNLSNPAFNEFYIELFPASMFDPTSNSKTMLPTVVLRQRPYNISDKMLDGCADYIDYAQKKKLFPEDKSFNASKSLLDISGRKLEIFGPMASIKNSNYDLMQNEENISDTSIDLIQYQVGLSSHERLNAFLVKGDYNTGYASSQDHVALVEEDVFKIDIESVNRFGMKIMELSTQFAQPQESKEQTTTQLKFLKYFTGLIANWYYLNHVFLNGRMVCRYIDKAVLGVPMYYYETRVTTFNPYPKAEIFYVQGVTDNYQTGGIITTTFTIIRGLRYKLNKSSDGKVANQTLRDRVAGVFKNEVVS